MPTLAISLSFFLASLLMALPAAGEVRPPSPSPAPQAIPDDFQPLPGTLFFSREQRDRLDRARKRGEVVDEGGAILLETPPVIGGYLRRSDGKITVWVDGKPYADRAPTLVQRVGPAEIGGDNRDRVKILIPSEAAAVSPPPAKKVRRPARAPAAKKPTDTGK